MRLFVIIIFSLIVGYAFPDDQEHQLLNQEELLMALQAALGDGAAQALFAAQEQVPDEASDEVKAVDSKKTRFAHINFSREYLDKYYPKALVITNHFFAAMTPEAVEQALKDIVIMLADRPFFYFVNNENKFKITAYWECIVDQLSLINEFLCTAYINKDRSIGSINEIDEVRFNVYQPSFQRTWLLDWLMASEKKVLADFFALCFDYTVKLFNEGILLSDFMQATRYMSELVWLSEKLRGSIYESDYAESIKTVRELYDLLKQRLGLANKQLEEQHDWF